MHALHTRILIILILGAVLTICQVSAASRNPSDCCLATSDKRFPYKILSSHRQQGYSTGCNVDAVVFTTHKNRHLCAPPDADWVRKYMSCLNGKKKTCKL